MKFRLIVRSAENEPRTRGAKPERSLKRKEGRDPPNLILQSGCKRVLVSFQQLQKIDQNNDIKFRTGVFA